MHAHVLLGWDVQTNLDVRSSESPGIPEWQGWLLFPTPKLSYHDTGSLKFRLL